jgi:DnaJ-class molecular chaperone
MLCTRCQGRGNVLRYPAEVRFGRFLMHSPCPDCNGSGIASCCEVTDDPEANPQEGE